jgi:hypothetical protein
MKGSSAKIDGKLLNLNRNYIRIQTRLLTGHCHLQGHLFKLRLVKRLEWDRCKQAAGVASHVLCDCKALVTLRFRHLGCHFISGDFDDISVSRILHSAQGLELVNTGT